MIQRVWEEVCDYVQEGIMTLSRNEWRLRGADKLIWRPYCQLLHPEPLPGDELLTRKSVSVHLSPLSFLWYTFIDYYGGLSKWRAFSSVAVHISTAEQALLVMYVLLFLWYSNSKDRINANSMAEKSPEIMWLKLKYLRDNEGKKSMLSGCLWFTSRFLSLSLPHCLTQANRRD